MTRPCSSWMRSSSRVLAVAAGAWIICTLAVPALAEQPSRRGAPESPAATPTPEQVRERLEQRLAQARRLVERLESAIREIDDGGEPAPLVRDRALLDTPRDNPPPRPGRRVDSPEAREITPEQVAAFLREHLPELAERVDTLLAERPKAGEGLLRVFTPQVATILHTPDPALRDLRTREMVNRYRLMQAGHMVRAARGRADRASLEQAEARFIELAVEQHALRGEAVELEIRAIERRLTELRERLETETESREAFIERLRREFEREPRGSRPPR